MKSALATCVIACAMFVGLLFGASTSWATVSLVPIISEKSSLHDIDLDELRRIFLGYAKLGPDGRPLIPLNHPPGGDVRVECPAVTTLDLMALACL
jgi:hypothetical protein